MVTFKLILINLKQWDKDKNSQLQTETVVIKWDRP